MKSFNKNRIGGGMIIGIFFLLFGASILLKVFFNIHLPLVRVCIAAFLIYAGVRMLIGSFGERENSKNDSHSVVFSSSDFKWEDSGENHYNVVFGKTVVDLTQIPKDKMAAPIEVNVVFGETTVLIDPKMPVRIRANAAFGEARMPDENRVAFGTMKYSTPTAKNDPGTLKIRGNVVFGSLKFKISEDGAEPKASDQDED